MTNKGDFCLIGWEEIRSHTPKCHTPAPQTTVKMAAVIWMWQKFGVFARQMLLFETEEYFVTFISIWLKDLQANGTGITSIGRQYVQPRLRFGGRRDDRTKLNLRGRTSSAVFQNVGDDKQIDWSKVGLSPWTNQLLIKYFMHAFN